MLIPGRLRVIPDRKSDVSCLEWGRNRTVLSACWPTGHPVLGPGTPSVSWDSRFRTAVNLPSIKKGQRTRPTPRPCLKTLYLSAACEYKRQVRIYRDVGVVVQTNNPAFVSNRKSAVRPALSREKRRTLTLILVVRVGSWRPRRAAFLWDRLR